jgi:hypothetical protein
MHLDECGEGREDLRGWRESKGEIAEAEEAALPPEAHVLSGGMVERDVKVVVPQVDGSRPIAWSEGVDGSLPLFPCKSMECPGGPRSTFSS